MNYEIEEYKELAKAFPAVRGKVKVKETGKEGRVIGADILNQMVKVEFAEREIAHFALSDLSYRRPKQGLLGKEFDPVMEEGDSGEELNNAEAQEKPAPLPKKTEKK